MALGHSPRIVTDGLVFYYDMSNTQKSWKGAPTTNLHPIDSYYTWPTQTIHFWNGNNWVVDSTYTDPGVYGPLGVYLGKVRKYTSGALSASWSGNSYAYILKTAAMTAGQSYAMSAYTFLSGDCNIDGMYSSIEGASVAALSGGYVTAYDMAQKGSWQRQGLQGTASGNVNFIIAYPQRYGITNGSFTGSILVGGAQVEFGTFPTPYTDTSRSNTQAILDLTNNSTITAASLTYANNNTFSFDGSSNNLSIGSFSGYSTNITCEAWFKTTSGATWKNIVCGPTNDVIFTVNGGLLNFGCQGSTPIPHANYSTTTVNTGAWFHGVATYDGSNVRIYINGNLESTNARTGIITSGAKNIGSNSGGSSEYFNGTIATVRVYNRALSAAEVQQNFNAHRGRYGL